jgi:SET domain-containing protein 6
MQLPDALVSLVRLLMLERAEWGKVRAKGRPPRPQADATVLRVVEKVLVERLGIYHTNVKVSFFSCVAQHGWCI